MQELLNIMKFMELEVHNVVIIIVQDYKIL